MNGKNKENPILDIKQLRDDYRNGYSAMGKPDRGYYITSWRGMQSLQAYCTSEWVHQRGGGAPTDKLREVQVKNDGKQYAMKSWTYDKFESHLVRSLRDEGVPIKKSITRNNSDEIYEAVLNNVYDGELDRTAFLEASTSQTSPLMRYDIETAMKLDVLRAKDGRNDRYAQAGAFAYEKGLASSARLVDFDGDQSDDLMGHRYTEMNNDEWMRQSERVYMDALTDKSNWADTYELESAKELIGHVQSADPKLMARREDDWDKLVGYMRKNVMFFLDDKKEVQPGLGMSHQKDIHRAVGVSEEQDYFNSYNKYEPRHIPQPETEKRPYDHDHTFDFDNDDLDF